MKCGLTIEKAYDFEDHHFYSRAELQNLIDVAQQEDLDIYTTRKDFVKIPLDLQPLFHVLDIKAQFQNEKMLIELLSASHLI